MLHRRPDLPGLLQVPLCAVSRVEGDKAGKPFRGGMNPGYHL